MASLAAACRLSTRLAGRKLARETASRGLRTSAAALAAQNFTMPALSPTMTEGNIATWRVKEGEKFAAGDVLLEIETDKATMDVEAQEDGILFKITQGDGSKGVEVGTRIAVLAEEGDDISAMEVPPNESPKQSAPKQEAKEADKPAPEPSKPSSSEASPPPKSSTKTQKQTYPLLPSVAQLMHENGLDESKVGEMTPTGPNGRLLKGDVLAYMGTIKSSVPAGNTARFEKMSHLDLSNVKAAKAPAPKRAEKADASTPKSVEALSLTLPVSLSAVIQVQKKMQESLGVSMPLSTFISRATDVANDELPLSSTAKPSADELFNQILGAKPTGPKASQGFYFPQISAMHSPSLALKEPNATKSDIIDVLTGKAKSTKPAPAFAPGILPGMNAFSLIVPRGDEKRAMTFLERIKLVLETEPGRLVL